MQLLDLSDNRISNASEAAAARLFAGARRVRLAGNPLACDCARRDLLDALRTNRQLVRPTTIPHSSLTRISRAFT